MKDWFNGGISRLYNKYKPPFGDWRFWAIQALSIGIAAAHWAIESSPSSEFGRLYFVPVILLIVPVVIAALYFGSVGAFTTALWVVLISIPNLVIHHTGLERVGEAFQMVVLLAVAFFMGRQVDNERNLRHKIEDASTALTSSEAKYHSLFNSSPVAILALDRNDIIIDANPSAGVLFGRSVEALKNMVITDLLKNNDEAGLPASPQKNNNWWESTLTVRSQNGPEVYLEPKLTQLNDSQGNPIIQVLLRDVTEERHRQAGLEAYAAYVIQAQEDERQHIARELHDETLQNLSLLCRQLNGIETSGPALPSAVVEELTKSRDMAEKAVKDLRNFTRRLRPPILDDLGLVASIRRLVLDFTDRTGMKGQLKIVGKEHRLQQDIEVSMFRIAQEALWNVEHHSKASKADVIITFGKDVTLLIINDDGIGFKMPVTLESISLSGKLGLLGMKERAELFGGKLKIQSTPGKGTAIIASFPSGNDHNKIQTQPV